MGTPQLLSLPINLKDNLKHTSTNKNLLSYYLFFYLTDLFLLGLQDLELFPFTSFIY